MLHARLMSLGVDIGFLPNVLEASPDLPVAAEPTSTPHPLARGGRYAELYEMQAGRYR